MKLPGAMFLVFLTLKLCGVIDWSWWWITAPIWVAVIIVFVIEFIKELARIGGSS